MNNPKTKGFLYGIITSVTFGLIPLFTLPLMQKGMHSDSILFYRFAFATLALGGMMLFKKESFAINLRDIPLLVFLAFLYTISALFLLWGYEVMGAGIATTLHFTYPVFVTLLMLLIFKEKTPWITWIAIFLAVYGVAKLSLDNPGEQGADATGVAVVLCSAIGYATYIIAVNRSRLRNVNSRKLAFYVFVFTTLLFGLKTGTAGNLQPLPDAWSLGNVLLLAILPTVISNITLLLAVRHIGGTLTAILGAMEPVTAVCIGAFVFGETLTIHEGFGILLILIAVTMIILCQNIQASLATFIKRIRPRHA